MVADTLSRTNVNALDDDTLSQDLIADAQKIDKTIPDIKQTSETEKFSISLQ